MTHVAADLGVPWATVAQHINDRMAELMIEQAELARRAGVSDATVRALMRGTPRGEPRRVILAKIAVALGWTPESIEQILGGGEPRDATRRPPSADEDLREALDELADLVADSRRQLAEVAGRIEARQQRVDDRLEELADAVRRLATRVLELGPE